MSRLFVQASAQNLIAAAAPVTATPITLAAWLFPSSLSLQYLLSLNDGGVSNHFSLGINAVGQPNAVISDLNGGGFSTFGQSVTVGVWGHLLAVFASTSSRTIYFNGTAGTPDTNSRVPANINQMQIGVVITSGYTDGRIAEVGVWNVALTADEITALARGLSPFVIRPTALVGFWPLWGDEAPESDWNPSAIHNPMTVLGNPTKAMHAPICPLTLMPPGPVAAFGVGVLPYWLERRWPSPTLRVGSRQLQGL